MNFGVNSLKGGFWRRKKRVNIKGRMTWRVVLVICVKDLSKKDNGFWK